jgi:hypothetical protein
VLAELYKSVADIRRAVSSFEQDPGRTTEVAALFESVQVYFETNAIRLDSETCEVVEALLPYGERFKSPDRLTDEPEFSEALQSKLAATKDRLEGQFRGRVGMK